jgi:hypothetical protein
VAGGEEGDLLLDFADVIVAAFEIDVFDCDGLAGSFVEGAVYDSEGAACEGVVRSCSIKSEAGNVGTYCPAPPACDSCPPTWCVVFPFTSVCLHSYYCSVE